ncbi:hypothetical protein [Aeromonas australiensis]|uniref:hypothetical protein n=1 Tax=Aeromonas australiensis TaxID=1114880 RepID=UPI00058A16EE|nr:hypothetical protein [Aeromonas australiensis]
MIVLSCGENCQLKFGIDESNALRDKIVEIIGDGESRNSVRLISDNKSGFDAVKIAFDYNITVVLDGHEFKPGSNKVNLGLLLLGYAKNEVEEQEAIDFVALNSHHFCPEIMSQTSLIDYVWSQTSNRFHTRIAEAINKHLFAKKSAVSLAHNFYTKNDNITETNIDLCHERLCLDRFPGIHIVVTPPGTGKTTNCLIPTFDEAGNNGMHPIFLNPSRAFNNSLYHNLDNRNYQTDTPKNETGVYGVSLSILYSKKYKHIRDKCQILIIDEFEDVFNLMHSELGMRVSVDEYIERMDNFKKIITDASTVVIADAFLSQDSFDFLVDLAEFSNKKVFVYRSSKPKVMPEIFLTTKPDIINKINERASSDKKCIVFSDEAHNAKKSNVNVLVNAINTPNKILIDADTARKYPNGAINKNVSSKLVSIFTPVVKNGFSFTDKDLTFTAIISNGLVQPNDIMQFVHRARNANNAFLALIGGKNRVYKNSDHIITELVMSALGCDYSIERLYEYCHNPTLMHMVNRLFIQHKLCLDYNFTLLTMLEQQGYKISYLLPEMTISDKKMLELAELKTEEERICGLLNRSEFYAQEAFDIEDFYGEKLSEGLIKFDDRGNSRRIITNNIPVYRGADYYNSQESITFAMIKSLANELKLSENYCYSSDEAGKFLAWIENGKFKFGHELIAVKKFFNKDHFIIPSKRGIPIRFLESFLNKNFGYKTDSSKPKNYYRDGPGSVRSKRAVKIAYLPNDISYWLTKKLASQ